MAKTTEKAKFMQKGKTLILTYKETPKSKAEKYRITVADKEERDALVKKIKGYATKINTSKSDLVVVKQSKTLINLFKKNALALQKETETKKLEAKGKRTIAKKANKKTTKEVAKKTTAIDKLTKQIDKLSPEEKKELLAQLGEGKQIAKEASSKPKTPPQVGRGSRREY